MLAYPHRLFGAAEPIPSRGSTKPRGRYKPSKIRDVNFTASSAAPHASTKQASVLYCKHMNTETFSVRLNRSAKTRLQKLAKSTGRSRAFLAAVAIHEYLDVNEWQIARIKRAIASLDRSKGIPHARVKAWVSSWGGRKERPMPKGA